MQYLFGIHPVIEAIRAGKKFDKVLLKQGMEGPAYRELITLIGENQIPYQYVLPQAVGYSFIHGPQST